MTTGWLISVNKNKLIAWIAAKNSLRAIFLEMDCTYYKVMTREY